MSGPFSSTTRIHCHFVGDYAQHVDTLCVMAVSTSVDN